MNVVKNVIGHLFEESPFPFVIRYWDGKEIKYGIGKSDHKIIFHTPWALCRFIFGLPLGFGEGYTSGEIDVEGNLQELLTFPYRSVSLNPFLKAFTAFLEYLSLVKKRKVLSSLEREISNHYDIGTEFYKLWLDDNLQYTCSYFTDKNIDLDSSQVEKMDYICRKVELKEGEKVIELGCGWGGLAVYAAKNYGVNVMAYDISSELINYAKKNSEKHEVKDLVTFINDNYKNVAGVYDKFISVGMIEHVGKKNYREFIEVIKKTLKKGGQGFVQFIGKVSSRRNDAWIEKHIFPGTYTPTLSQLLSAFEKGGLVVRDVENLRLHYARTIDHWTERFESNIYKIREMFDDRFARMWRLYLNYTSVGFKYGDLALYQIVFTNGFNNTERLTNKSLYVPCKQIEKWNYTI